MIPARNKKISCPSGKKTIPTSCETCGKCETCETCDKWKQNNTRKNTHQENSLYNVDVKSHVEELLIKKSKKGKMICNILFICSLI